MGKKKAVSNLVNQLSSFKTKAGLMTAMPILDQFAFHLL